MNKESILSSFRHNLFAVLFFRLIIIMFLFAISRMALYFFNSDLFSDIGFNEIFQLFFAGLRFDISILILLCAFMILGNTIPIEIKYNKAFRKAVNSLSIILVFIALSLNFADAIYYRFTLKRMTFDIFSYVDKTAVFWDVAPQMMIDYWYTWVLSVLLLLTLVYFFYQFSWIERKVEYSWKKRLRDSFVFLIAGAVMILGFRGGFQLRPINIVDANKYANASLSPLILNTPFTIIKSYGQTGLKKKEFFEKDELERLFNPIQSYPSSQKNLKNVVIIILESFSMEHIGSLSGKKTFTPFLDSLFEHSLAIKGMANGKRSIEGIPAILSSLPTLSDESFINSPYSVQNIEGIAKTLAKYGYISWFFHGGKNGTMSFDSYTSACGFDRYYGMNEYPDNRDYDGHWGIWDEEFLQYFKKKIDEMSEPFLASVFTLSSHHPFKVPKRYEGVFPEGELEIQKTIAYTDHALGLFFEEAKKEVWFNNTLFVITADHTSQGASWVYQRNLGQFCIPIAFFAPADSNLSNYQPLLPVQQIDIFPSIIDYLGVGDSIIGFGSSIFKQERQAFAVNFFNQRMQFMDTQYLLHTQEDELQGVYIYQKDSTLKRNKIGQIDIQDLLRFQKAFIQQYNNRMIENQLTIKKNE